MSADHSVLTFALTHSQGTLLTVAVIVAVVLFFGVIVISDDLDWFD